MKKPKIIVFPPIHEKKRVLLINNKLINLTMESEESNLGDEIAYEGILTPTYMDHYEELLGYSNWPDSEYGEYGEINPLDENILHLNYYVEEEMIIIIGYHLTKLVVGEIEFTDYFHATDEEGNIGTIFSNITEPPFIENVSINIILYL